MVEGLPWVLFFEVVVARLVSMVSEWDVLVLVREVVVFPMVVVLEIVLLVEVVVRDHVQC